MHHPVYELISR